MVIRFEFGAADLAGLRFAHSPMAEVVASLFARRSASFRYASWRRGVSLDDLPVLRAVVDGPLGYAPDFLTPVPRVPRPALSDELRAITTTDPDTAVEQVLTGWRGHTEPPEVTWFAAQPRKALAALAVELRRYFDHALAPVWPRLRTLADTEVSARSRAAAERGPRVLVDGLHPRLAWDGDALLIKYPDKSGYWPSVGDLTLLPTGFAGDHVYAMSNALWYAPTGHGAVWGHEPQRTDPLAALIGPTRARVLALLARPQSTGEVAAAMRLAPATASHHLTTLRDAGLVAPTRDGRRLVYHRTALGDQLGAAATQ